MKRRYLTQRFMYDINRKRMDDQLKKRFGRPRVKAADTRNITFIMTIEVIRTTTMPMTTIVTVGGICQAAYALRRLVRIEHCYVQELLQPLPNRVAQVISHHCWEYSH